MRLWSVGSTTEVVGVSAVWMRLVPVKEFVPFRPPEYEPVTHIPVAEAQSGPVTVSDADLPPTFLHPSLAQTWLASASSMITVCLLLPPDTPPYRVV